jgi:predicted transcriptional regulator
MATDKVQVMSWMDRTTVDALDQLCQRLERKRSYLVWKAVQAYLAQHALLVEVGNGGLVACPLMEPQP